MSLFKCSSYDEALTLENFFFMEKLIKKKEKQTKRDIIILIDRKISKKFINLKIKKFKTV